MRTPGVSPGKTVVPRTRNATLLAALSAAVIANLIHNNFGLDMAIAPAILFGGLYWWRCSTWLLWVTAIAIAVPAFSFLDWGALTDLYNTRRFFNHVALLLAGAFAVLSVLRPFVTPRQVREKP